MQRILGSRIAFLVVFLSYGGALMLCRLCRRRPKRSKELWGLSELWKAEKSGRPARPTGRLVIPTTFRNPGWFRAHVTPLARSGLAEVVIVADEPLPHLQGVRFDCPPKWVSTVLGRALAKFVWTLRVGKQAEPDMYMGYHIIPGALTALIAGRLFSRPTCYQMTAGPAEIIGGGFGRDNPVLERLGRPSALLERLALAVVREFDLVVVRGSRAQEFLSERGVAPIAVIPGSVDPERFQTSADRSYDMLFVGQLIERKQPFEFVEIVSRIAQSRPSVRAAICGDGPLAEAVRQRIADVGLTQTIDMLGKRADVETVVCQSRVFVLMSQNEGLSIALAEAMLGGAVPVATDVGDLADLVHDGVNGYLIEPGNRQHFIHRIERLLNNSQLWSQLSGAAIESARSHNSLAHVTTLWTTHLQEVLSEPQMNERFCPDVQRLHM